MFIEKAAYYHVHSKLPHGGFMASASPSGIDWAKEWPESSSMLCWHCCHPIPGRPYPIPYKYDDRLDTFLVTGACCSLACVKTYLRHSCSTAHGGETSTILTLFNKRCGGVMSKCIRSAPPRMMLAAFGGTMSIEEFRARSEDDHQYELIPPKMILRQQIVAHEAMRDARKMAVAHDLTERVKLTTVAQTPETSDAMRTRNIPNRPVASKQQNSFEKLLGITFQ